MGLLEQSTQSKGILLFAFAVAVIAIYGYANGLDKGTLQGKVSVGPLCPVEPCNLDPAQAALAYTSRNATVYSGRAIIKQMPLNADGTYRVELAPGTYSVAIVPAGIRAMEPKEAVVNPNQDTVLDFDIDTGMR